MICRARCGAHRYRFGWTWIAEKETPHRLVWGFLFVWKPAPPMSARHGRWGVSGAPGDNVCHLRRRRGSRIQQARPAGTNARSHGWSRWRFVYRECDTESVQPHRRATRPAGHVARRSGCDRKPSRVAGQSRGGLRGVKLGPPVASNFAKSTGPLLMSIRGRSPAFVADLDFSSVRTL